MSNLREECGVFGVYSNENYDLARMTYYGLFALQHRGQESCGITINDDGVFTTCKDTGLVNDVFTNEKLDSLGTGTMAIGHVRYGAEGTSGVHNAQPMVVNHIKGRMALAHNGQLINGAELRADLELKGSIFHTNTNLEVISYIITEERLRTKSIEEAISNAMHRVKGAYSLLVMSPTKLIAVRDEMGFRPLCYGKTKEGMYVVASESCALDSVGAEFIREVEPGEIVVFDKDGVRSITTHCNKQKRKMCVFEFVYFSRPDSIIDGSTVHEARMRAGAFLAKEHPVDADVVIGVPDSGLDAALGYAKESGIPYEIGFIKNKYIGRTFIAPGQESREDKVKIKLNPVMGAVKGKRVVMIDDSIVRGTTGARIVKLLREAGATEVHMRVSAPPFVNPCYYGTDIDSKDKLIACKYSHEEIEKILGVDSLGFLSLDAVKEIACMDKNKGYCTACFDGNYPTEVPEKTQKSKFDFKISENKGR